ncbi:MAG: ImmA/IrrE family metallo-endopeptidase [Lachnospiraceae bacterium]|nr:ImmA/IrrE family metallo-endopeptidase [Lachnospiraceae bacterium]
MSSIDHNELFKQYYQNEYDFNTTSLSSDEIADIKKLAREKRVDYALAPMGTGVFNWILKQNSNIRFELVSFDSEKIDGMLYIPTTGKERAYIILNANKPLINQIFTAVHEYYHYVKDYQKFKEAPYICDFNILKDVNEMRACRFAAEILLPEEALLHDVQDFCRSINITNRKALDFGHFATLSIFLTVKYQMPLKAVIYRLEEEHYIDSIDRYIENYEFIKKVLQEIQIFGKGVSELYSTENNYVLPYRSTYQDMEKAFLTGNASKESILEDASKLDLDMSLINAFLAGDVEVEDADDDDELFSIINAKRG